MATMAAPKSAPRKAPKKLDHLRVIPAENGGHTIEHHFDGYDHQPEAHVFGESEGHEAMAHIAEHAGLPKPAFSGKEDADEDGEYA